MQNEMWDWDTLGLMAMRAAAQAWEIQEVDRRIHARCEAVRSGLEKVSPFIQAAIGKLNRKLRARWDLSAGPWDHSAGNLVIEEFVPSLRAWLKTCDWKTELGEPVTLGRMLEILKEADCANEDPQVKRAREQADAAKRRADNEKAASERVLAAIDSLSSRQVVQFLQAERALRTGETIIAHGKDLEFLEKAHENTLRELAEAEAMGERLADLQPMMPNKRRANG